MLIVHLIIILYLPANELSTQNSNVFRSTKPDSILEQTRYGHSVCGYNPRICLQWYNSFGL